jgi:hypothetical protein
MLAPPSRWRRRRAGAAVALVQTPADSVPKKYKEYADHPALTLPVCWIT